MLTRVDKRIRYLLLAVLLCAALLGCAPKEPPSDEITQLSQLEGGSCGVTRSIRASGTESMTYADCADMNEAFFQLASKEVDCLLVPDFVATYLTLREPALGMIEGPQANDPSAEHGIAMMLRTDDAALRDSIDAALSAMRDDGTLAALHEEWVTDLYPFKVLEGEALPLTDGAQTLRVGLTAELEPLDYIDADGLAGGYSARLLRELSGRTGLNFTPVRVGAQNGIAALSSGEVDLLFAVEPGSLEQIASSYAGTFTTPHFAYGKQHYLVARDYTRLRGCTDMSRTNSRSGGSASPFKEFTQ